LRQAQSERQVPIDLVSALVGDELIRRRDRLIARRIQQARFRDPNRTLDAFDLDFNKKMNRALIHDLATAASSRNARTSCCSDAGHREKSPRPGPLAARPSCKDTASSIARRTSSLEELADATLDGTRKISSAETDRPCLPLIIDDLGMRKLPHTAAEDLLEIIMRRYEGTSTLADIESPRR
jgi:DNA replication protein DnaC